MSFDLTQLVGFYFNGLGVATVDIATATTGDGSLAYVPGSTIYNVTASNFASDNSDEGFGTTNNVLEEVTAASNGTSIDGSPLNNPLAIGQIVYNDIVNGAPSPSLTYDVLGYSADGSSLLVAQTLAYNPNTQTNPYGSYNIISDQNIDGNASPSLFPSGTQTFSPANSYVGGPVSSGGVAADLVTVTNSLIGLSIPTNSITTTTSGTGVVQNSDGSYTLLQTSAVYAVGKGTMTALTSAATGAEGQATLKFTAAGGTTYFQVVGFNTTQILLEAVSSAGAAIGTPRYYVLSITNPPAQNVSVNVAFNNFGTAPYAGQAYPCFLQGTRIATPRGEVAVESLAVGDLVFTVSGQAKPIIWIGHTRIHTRFQFDPGRVMPIRIAADAFAAGVPLRDVYLSPDHAVFVDNMLIPVKELCNGVTIHTVSRSFVAYYHVELPQHDIVFAEGLPAESYLDSGNREILQGAPIGPAGFDRTDLDYIVWESFGYRPLTISGEGLLAVRAKLQQRAEILRSAVAA